MSGGNDNRNKPSDPWQGNGWTQYQKLVLAELERNAEGIKELNEKKDERLKEMNIQFGEIKIQIAMLKVKAGIWGLMAGMVPVVIALAIESLKK